MYTLTPLVTSFAAAGRCVWNYRLGTMVHRCLQGRAPQYLIDCCIPTSDTASRQRLRSATRHQLIVPRRRRSRFGRRAFSVAGPMVKTKTSK